MSMEEEVTKCGKIHDVLAEHWNWAYYDTPHGECSWLLAEYVERLKEDVERRVPVMLKELEELVEEYPSDSFSILDVGCGVGGFLHGALNLLSKKHKEVEFKTTGIDISREMIDYAKTNLQDTGIELVCDSITNQRLKFKNEPFDAAILMVTLSFYNDENSKEILRAIHNKLKDGGFLLILDFAWTYIWSGFKLFSKPLQSLTDTFFSHLIGESFHFMNRTEDELKELITEAGFDVKRAYLSEKKSKMKGMLVIRAQKK
ncbi:MAG: class I SAM-dependent methyltransferase [Candidatus Bathyarchaeota archaeon]|nr:MAG: class I SAM-dependent methyltransferase [Candidatus Bathyarchaeota archaeon]